MGVVGGNWHKVNITFWYGVLVMLLLGCSTDAPSAYRYPVFVNGKWGYINFRGELVIAPQFLAARDFHEGLAAVKVDSLWGCIDITGSLVIPPTFPDWGQDFHHGLAVASLKRTIDETDESVTWVYIDMAGKVVFRTATPVIGLFMQEKVGKLFDNRAVVGITDTQLVQPRYGYIDKKGNWQLKPRFFEARRYSVGLAAVMPDTAGFIFIDEAGSPVITKRFRDATYFSEGLAAVAEGGFIAPYAIRMLFNAKWGYIDNSGKYVIPPQFSYAGPFVNGLAMARVDRTYLDGSFILKENGRCGYINHAGKFVIQPQWDDASDFVGNLAVVGLGNKAGVINREGDYVLPLQTCFFGDLKLYPEGVIALTTGDDRKIQLYYDSKGNLIYKPEE